MRVFGCSLPACFERGKQFLVHLFDGHVELLSHVNALYFNVRRHPQPHRLFQEVELAIGYAGAPHETRDDAQQLDTNLLQAGLGDLLVPRIPHRGFLRLRCRHGPARH